MYARVSELASLACVPRASLQFLHSNHTQSPLARFRSALFRTNRSGFDDSCWLSNVLLLRPFLLNCRPISQTDHSSQGSSTARRGGRCNRAATLAAKPCPVVEGSCWSECLPAFSSRARRRWVEQQQNTYPTFLSIKFLLSISIL
jgi:hypothetical protein